MIVLLIVFIVFFIIIAYILFAPFYLEVDTEMDLLKIRFHYLASAQLILTGNSVMAEIKVAGLRKRFDLLASKEM